MIHQDFLTGKVEEHVLSLLSSVNKTVEMIYGFLSQEDDGDGLLLNKHLNFVKFSRVMVDNLNENSIFLLQIFIVRRWWTLFGMFCLCGKSHPACLS